MSTSFMLVFVIALLWALTISNEIDVANDVRISYLQDKRQLKWKQPLSSSMTKYRLYLVDKKDSNPLKKEIDLFKLSPIKEIKSNDYVIPMTLKPGKYKVNILGINDDSLPHYIIYSMTEIEVLSDSSQQKEDDWIWLALGVLAAIIIPIIVVILKKESQALLTPH